MSYVPLGRFLFRAPLLPLRTVADGRHDLLAHPLGMTALTLASPDLAAAHAAPNGKSKDTRRTDLAIDRYRRRAGFRATPHGLWAGVGIGTLGARTNFRTGEPRATFRVAFKRLADLARALLADPDVRPHVRLRRAPSVIEGTRTVIWLGPENLAGEHHAALVEKRTERDQLIANLLEAAWDWAPWSVVRTAIAGAADDDEADDLLLTMIDDGLLHTDLVPPLVGPAPGDWMRDRLDRGAAAAASGSNGKLLADVPAFASAAALLAQTRRAANAGDLTALRTALRILPGATTVSGVDATLLFRPRAPITLSRLAVTRAADLAPLLFGLQNALIPPAAERVPDVVLADALDATTEIFGAGALNPDALTLGEYGVSTAAEGEDVPGPASAEGPPRALLTLLVDRIVEASRKNLSQVRLHAGDLDPLVPPVELPATCELFLTPCRPRAGKPPGEAWLLGLHAPAGASWGRFAHALGDDAAPLLEPLRAAEVRARPGEQRLDVVFAPRDTLGDICAHPPLRAAALALTGWPADDSSALTVADLELCADAAAREPLALRTTRGMPVAPSALHRVRSTTAPGGIWRLLVGWNLYRQHAPWALILGPLSDLDWTPRIAIDGFVVAPASWRLPPVFGAGTASAGDLRAWRKRVSPPRFVQVGAEDELLPVDLTAPAALLDLAGQQRVFEIWPPLDDTPDTSGRRVEAIVALADQPDMEGRARIEAALAGTTNAGAVPPPRRTPRPKTAISTDTWYTFKIFGGGDFQDGVLLDVVAPAIRQARLAMRLTGWFFLRYVDLPGRRTHLRVRVRATKGDEARFARALRRLSDPAWEAGDVVALEQGPYFPESARFGGPDAMEAAHTLFEADSDLACALLAIESGAGSERDSATPVEEGTDGEEEMMAEMLDLPDLRVLLQVCAFHALAGGLGLDAQACRDLARRRRDAHAADIDDAAAEREHGRAFRALGPHLRKLLAGGAPANIAAALDAYGQRVRQVGASLGSDVRDRLLAPLLHLSAVRLTGLDRSAEMRAYSFWMRTLESLARHRDY